jgi:hypothetical protein
LAFKNRSFELIAQWPPDQLATVATDRNGQQIYTAGEFPCVITVDENGQRVGQARFSIDARAASALNNDPGRVLDFYFDELPGHLESAANPHTYPGILNAPPTAWYCHCFDSV